MVMCARPLHGTTSVKLCTAWCWCWVNVVAPLAHAAGASIPSPNKAMTRDGTSRFKLPPPPRGFPSPSAHQAISSSPTFMWAVASAFVVGALLLIEILIPSTAVACWLLGAAVITEFRLGGDWGHLKMTHYRPSAPLGTVMSSLAGRSPSRND